MYFTIFVTPHNFLVERYRPWYTIVFQMAGTGINTNDKTFLRHTLVNYITQVWEWMGMDVLNRGGCRVIMRSAN